MNPWGSQEQLPTNFREGFDALRKSWVPGSNKFSNSASLGSQNQVNKIKHFLHWRIGKQHIIKTCSFSLDRYGGRYIHGKWDGTQKSQAGRDLWLNAASVFTAY